MTLFQQTRASREAPGATSSIPTIRSRATHWVYLLLAGLALPATASWAQTAPIAEAGAASSGRSVQAPGVPTATAMIGLGVAHIPEYPGARNNRTVPALFGEYVFANGVFISSMRGIGYGADIGIGEVSISLGHHGGRRTSTSSIYEGSEDLKGMGDISGSATVNLNATLVLGANVNVSVGGQFAATRRDGGNTYELSLDTPLYNAPGNQVNLNVGLQFQDSKRATSYYSVTDKQSLASGYRRYSADKGVEHYNLGLSWTHVLDDRWSVRTSGMLTRMAGSAADSPLTRNPDNGLLILTFNYRY